MKEVLVGVVIGLALGFIMGFFIGIDNIEKTAIEQKVARYTCNPITGETTLQWGYGCFTNDTFNTIEK